MASRLSTSTMMKRIIKANNLDTFLTNHGEQFETLHFCTLLKQFSEEKELQAARVIERSQIERTYGHQLFNGTRRPSRDKVIQLAFGLGLNVEETQKLLRTAGKSPLYPRLKRDAVILYGLRKSLTILAVQDALTTCGLTILGGLKNDTDG